MIDGIGAPARLLSTPRDLAPDPAAKAPTAVQKAALEKLHKATQELEGVFLSMMLKEMRATVPENSLLGNSPTEGMFNEMLDEQRAQAMAENSTLGVGKILETQLRQTVLQDAEHSSKVGIPSRSAL